MQTCETLKHTVWECKYHVVFIPKCRRKTLYGQIQREWGEVFRELVREKINRADMPACPEFSWSTISELNETRDRLAVARKRVLQQAQLLLVRDWKNANNEEWVGGPTVEFLGRAEKEMEIGFQELIHV